MDGYSTSVTIGKFDGVHLGHREIIAKLVEAAKGRGLKSAVLSFEPQPAELFTGRAIPRLMTSDEKFDALSLLGVDYFIEYAFTREFAAISPREFVEGVLAARLRASAVVVGENYRFGAGGAGDAAALSDICGELGIEVFVVPAKFEGGERVSSTRIRQAIEAGNIAEANALLGSAYAFSGKIQHGNEIGRRLNFPTVNLSPDPAKQQARNGVYSSRVFLRGREYRGLTNIGIRPTVTSGAERLVETFIFDFDEDVYGEWLRVELLEFIRPEIKFAGFNELKAQLERDKAMIMAENNGER